jgi:hypothetical protein
VQPQPAGRCLQRPAGLPMPPDRTPAAACLPPPHASPPAA